MALSVDNIIAEQTYRTNAKVLDRTITVVSASTLQLVALSTVQQVFTGSVPGQIINLPDALTLLTGQVYYLWNQSSTTIILQRYDSSTVKVLLPAYVIQITLRDNSTSTGVWDYVVHSDTNIHYRVATNETDFLAEIVGLSAIGGGTLHITDTIELTANRTLLLDNIRFISDSSINNGIVLNGFTLTIGGNGTVFQNCRFTGGVTTSGTRSQLAIILDPENIPDFLWFDNCMFKNLMGSLDPDVAFTPSGVVIDATGATGDFANIIFENCNSSSDWYTPGGPLLSPLCVRFAHGGGNKQMFVFGNIGQTEGRNKYSMAPLLGTASASTRVTFNTDGTGVYHGDIEVPSLGSILYSRSVAGYSLKNYLAATTGITLSTIKDEENYIDDGLIGIDATASNQTITMPATPSYMDGHTYVFDKSGSWNLILNNNGDNIAGVAAPFTVRGYNLEVKTTLNNGNWLLSSSNKRITATVDTTTATVTTLDSFTIPTNSVVLVEAKILARRTGGAVGAVGDSASYIRRARYKNVGGTVTVLSVTTEYTSEDVAGYNATLDATGTTGRVRVTGVANTNITWFSSLAIEVLV